MEREENVNSERKRLKAIRKFKKKQWKERKKARLVAEKDKEKPGTKPGAVVTKEVSVQFNIEEIVGPSTSKKSEGGKMPHPSRGREMLQAALKQCGANETRKRTKNSPQEKATVAEKRSKARQPEIKDIDRKMLQRLKGEGALGSGSYGTCYLAKYRGISVAVKELDDRKGKKTLRDLRRSAEREAQVLISLGDHKGLPLLFGICRESPPVCLVMLFHGIQGRSLTLYKATKKSPPLKTEEWHMIFNRIAQALKYVHDKGYLHNDLKGNNVVLERLNENEPHNPVIIDFGCSLPISESKPRPPQPNFMKEVNKNSHTAPEVLDGSGKPTTLSDIYSYGRMFYFVHKNCKISMPEKLKLTIDSDPNKRPSLEELLVHFKSLK